MFLIKAISALLIIYLTCYLVYFIYITYYSKLYKIKEIERRSSSVKYNLNLNVIIYSHNNEDNVASLVESLKKQEYSYDNYEINVILDSCTDNSAKKLKIIGGARLWRINNDGNIPVGKNKAISWLLERILKHENTNAFVLLNADSIVKPDLLKNINNEISEYPVVTGQIIYNSDCNNFVAGIINYKTKIINKFINRGRSFALNTILNTDVCAIRQDVLEKVLFQLVSNNNAEIDYSLELNKNNIPVKYSSQIIVFKKTCETLNSYLKKINIENVAKINGFRNNIKQIFSTNTTLKQKEFVCSLVYPSETFVALSLILAYFLFNGKINQFVIGSYALLFMLSASIIKLSFKDVIYGAIWTCLAPFLLAYNFVKNINKKFIVNLWNKQDKDEVEMINPSVKAVLTDGENEYPCNIEYISEDGLYLIVFWFKNKKLSSSKHLKYSDALQEVIDKLFEHKFALKVCQNCGYLKLSNNGRSNCDKGKCMLGIVNDLEKTPKITHIWDSCDHIIPIHAQKYVMSQLKNKPQ